MVWVGGCGGNEDGWEWGWLVVGLMLCGGCGLMVCVCGVVGCVDVMRVMDVDGLCCYDEFS